MPVVGVITPEAHAAVQATRNRRIGLLATQATVDGGPLRGARAHARRRRRAASTVACPALVPLIESDDPYGEATRRGGARVRGAAQGRRRRHGHPRLHALPADPPDPPARLRPRRHARLLRRGDRARGRGDARAQGDRERRRRATARTASSRPAIPKRSAQMGARFLQLPIADVEHVDARRARGGGMSRTMAAAPTSCGRSSCEPDFLEQPHGAVLCSAGQDEGALHGVDPGGRAALAVRQAAAAG